MGPVAERGPRRGPGRGRGAQGSAGGDRPDSPGISVLPRRTGEVDPGSHRSSGRRRVTRCRRYGGGTARPGGARWLDGEAAWRLDEARRGS